MQPPPGHHGLQPGAAVELSRYTAAQQQAAAAMSAAQGAGRHFGSGLDHLDQGGYLDEESMERLRASGVGTRFNAMAGLRKGATNAAQQLRTVPPGVASSYAGQTYGGYPTAAANAHNYAGVAQAAGPVGLSASAKAVQAAQAVAAAQTQQRPPQLGLPPQPPPSHVPQVPSASSLLPPQGPPPSAPLAASSTPPPPMVGEARDCADGAAAEDDSGLTPEEAKAAKDKYGLLGILKVIRMTEPDLNMLALGMDLTTLGLNLNSPECLYSTFASPWSNVPAQKDPEYYLPLCYYMSPPNLKTSHMQKINLETLFYVFHNMPRDTLQAYVAAELYNRGWKYHMDHKCCYSYEEGEDGHSRWVYFDTNSWERCYCQQPPDTSRFLSEDDVRVNLQP